MLFSPKDMAAIKITDHDLKELIAFVKSNYGIDLSSKKTFVELRLQKGMAQHGYTSYPEFFAYLCTDISGATMADFISNLTVNYTLFNREAAHFDFLSSVALPEICARERDGKDLRIWSAGCATGEEPYTLAMVLQDYFHINKSLWDTKILATDISTTALMKAQAGEYPVESIRDLSANWVRRYFIQEINQPDLVQVAPFIKEEIIFRKHNLVGAPYQFKKKFHIIFCRNVMIYFDERVKAMLINRLCDAMEDGGYLFIGMSETIEKGTSGFTYVQPSVYRKDPAVI